MRCTTLIGSLLLVFVIFIAPTASAHPEDEFCTPGGDSLDPELCRQLAEMDAKDAAAAPADVGPILDARGNVRGFRATAGLYTTIGVQHILPGGLDHILFVLAMFLAATTLRALILQISAFTVAHTVTLGLAASGVIAPSADIVEPLIALTIGFVAIENILFRDMTKWRPAIVFGFGLIHGMGFAGFFGELGLPSGQFWSALIGFNLGVEIGQLAVIVLAAAVAWFLRRQLPDAKKARQYRQFVVLPGSAVIGVFGFWWAFERLFG